MPAEVAKSILLENRHRGTDATRSASDLLELAQRRETDGGAWHVAIADADVLSLVAVLGSIAPWTGVSREKAEAFREATRAMVEKKLTVEMIERMEALAGCGKSLIRAVDPGIRSGFVADGPRNRASVRDRPV